MRNRLMLSIFLLSCTTPLTAYANLTTIYCPPTAICNGSSQESCTTFDKRFKIIRSTSYEPGEYRFHDAFAIFIIESQSAFCNYAKGNASVSFIMDGNPDIRFADWTKTTYPGGSTWSCTTSSGRCFFTIFPLNAA